MNLSGLSWLKRGLAAGLAVSAAIGFSYWLARPPSVSYRMPADGQLTLGLYTPQGGLVRWLVQDDFRQKGQGWQSWDGLDQWGSRVSAGDYVLRGIYHAPLKAEYLMTLGNPGTPPWPTEDGRGDWLCDEANPQAAATDGETVFLGSPGCERGFSIIAVDKTGHRQWGTDEPKHFHPRSLVLAVAGDFLYALYSGPVRPNADASPYSGRDAIGRAALVCLDKRTGRPAQFSRDHALLQVATWPYQEEGTWLWNLRNGQTFSPATYGGQPRYASLDLGEPTNAIGLAVVGDRLYVSLLLENKVAEFEADTGHPTGREISLVAPAGLCRLDDETLLAVSGREVVRIRLKDGQVTPLIKLDLVAPDSIAVDRRHQVYVSDWGNSFQVKVFDPTGHLLHTIGKAGGRPWVGNWESSGMLVPRGIAITDAGALWVAEDDGSPPRISVWNAATGAFVRDYLGPAPYGGGTYFWIDPKDPSEVHAEGTRFKVDYERKTWSPVAIDYRRRNRNDPFTTNGHDLGPHPQVRVLYRDGREYAVVNTTPTMVSILQRDGDGYHPVAALGQVHRDGQAALNGDGTERTVWDSDVGYRRYNGYFPECFRGHGGDSYSWADANDDHLVQPGEMTWVQGTMEGYRPHSGKLGRWASPWGCDLSKDWSFFFAARYQDRLAVFRLDPPRWTKAGAPVYDLSRAHPIFFEEPRHGIDGLHVTDDNKLIVSYDYESGRNRDAIAAYSLEGHKLWAVAMPARLTSKALHANNAMYDFTIPGLGDLVCSSLYHGNFRPFLFTSDGLYVGTFLKDTPSQRVLQTLGVPINQYVGTALDDAAPGPGALWSESAKYFYQGPDGRLLLINGGNQQEHLLTVRGLEERSSGRFEGRYQMPR